MKIRAYDCGVIGANEGVMMMREDESSLTIVSLSPTIREDYETLKKFLEEKNERTKPSIKKIALVPCIFPHFPYFQILHPVRLQTY